MAIIIKADFQDFRNAFIAAGRDKNFSWAGLEALFDYLEQLSEDCGEDYELDVIALCCDWDESTWEEVANNYRIEFEEDATEEEKIEAVREYLNDNTQYIELDNGSFVYLAF